MIEVESSRKPYGEFVAVNEISLPGPNGAGKSTAGKVRILGHDVIGEPVAAKRQLDVMPNCWRSMRICRRRKILTTGAPPTVWAGPNENSGYAKRSNLSRSSIAPKSRGPPAWAHARFVLVQEIQQIEIEVE